MARLRGGANDDDLSATFAAGTEPPESILTDAALDSPHAADSEVDLETVKAELAQLRRTVARLIEQRRDRAAGYFRNVAADAMWSGLDFAAFATDRSRSALAELEATTRRNPIGTLAAAFLLGVFVGLRRRR